LLDHLRTQVQRSPNSTNFRCLSLLSRSEIIIRVQLIYFSDPEITNLDNIIFSQQYVHAFQIPVDCLLTMKITDSQTYLKCNRPYHIFTYILTTIFDSFDVSLEISFLSIFHNDKKRVLIKEWIYILNDMRVILQSFHQFYFSYCFSFVSSLNFVITEANLFHNIYLIIFPISDFHCCTMSAFT